MQAARRGKTIDVNHLFSFVYSNAPKDRQIYPAHIEEHWAGSFCKVLYSVKTGTHAGTLTCTRTHKYTPTHTDSLQSFDEKSYLDSLPVFICIINSGKQLRDTAYLCLLYGDADGNEHTKNELFSLRTPNNDFPIIQPEIGAGVKNDLNMRWESYTRRNEQKVLGDRWLGLDRCETQ